MAADDVLVVCGLAAEARIVRGAGVRTIAGGGDAGRLASRVEAELDRGVAGLVSFGVAGALASSIEPGTPIVADVVVVGAERLACDLRWSAALRRVLPDAVTGAIAGSDRVVVATNDKARLARESGAIAVDMESHVVARAARRRALPFVVVRAVADPADRALPPAATVAMRSDGDLDLPAIVRSIVASPRQLPALLALGRETRAATAALRRARTLAGDRLGYDLLADRG